MEAYSMDLRERLITAYDCGDGSRRELAGSLLGRVVGNRVSCAGEPCYRAAANAR